MDSSFYASQFDTARELIASNTGEATTGLYSILCALYEMDGLTPSQLKSFKENKIHTDYKPAIICVYLVYHTNKQSNIYKNKVYQRPEAFMTIQRFKQDCFKEITIALQLIQPSGGIEWRMVK